MQMRGIGSLRVSLVGLGCNNVARRLDYERTVAVVDAALDAGFNFFDTADIYGGTKSEEFLGRALAGRRHRVVLATKFGMVVDDHRSGASPGYIRQACEESLRRLRTDFIDLYQLHIPDGKTPIGRTLDALNDLVLEGKVREIGCSNFSTRQLREARAAAGSGAGFVSVQNEYSLLHREPERDVLPECTRGGLAFVPFFPLASGLLTGKYRRGRPMPSGTRLAGRSPGLSLLSDRNLATAEALTEFAIARGHTLLELAFSWLAGQAAVASVIAGASSPEQIQANAAAVGWRLSPEDFAEVNKMAPPPRSPALRRIASLFALSVATACHRQPPLPVELPPTERRAILLNPDHPEWHEHAPETFLARVETSKGTIVIEVYRVWAPLGADRFYNLARFGFFDDSRFFRVVADYIAQFGVSGDPAITTMWKDRTFPDDPPGQASNTRTTVAFAMPGANARTTQIFISLKDNLQLDTQGFVPFGRVREGMDVVDRLYAGYGDSATGGIRAGRQGRMLAEGNVYLDQEFPRMDRLIRVGVR
jgi:aryl-alcohol dehydrogenase-like predicted oxidoreductase/cyclophilin family peptidyl-prolyl cis-trans isomerase